MGAVDQHTQRHSCVKPALTADKQLERSLQRDLSAKSGRNRHGQWRRKQKGGGMKSS